MARVLLVDDEPYVLHVLQQFFERSGHVVETAGDGEEALNRACSSPPEVLVTDVQMPRIGGQQLCEELALRCPDPRRLVLVMTSRTDRDLRAWAAGMANAEFFEKPVSPRRMLARVNELLKQRDDAAGG